MSATDAKPPAGTGGVVEGSGEQPTRGDYTGPCDLQSALLLADASEDEVLQSAWARIQRLLAAFAVVEDERGARARRALGTLTEEPFVPDSVHLAGQAIAWNFCAAVYTADPDLRARANKLVGEALRLAAEARQSLGRAA